MKSAYELAMERLQASDPDGVKKLSGEQKEQLADIERRFRAKIAERELFLNQRLAEARAKRETEAIQQIEAEIVNEKKKLSEQMEEEKNRVRKG